MNTMIPLIEIPAGSFLMGSPPNEAQRSLDEGPQHLVQLQGFFISQTPITQAQWREVAEWTPQDTERWGRELNPNPSRFSGQSDSDRRPVEQVSWYDAMEFCHRLSQRTGRHYTLPSEAQWEYACRAGTTTPFAFGATLSAKLANYDANYTYGDGPRGEYRAETTPVGMFPANAWGLHDMHGNVWEWCLDRWHDRYAGAPSDGSAWLMPSADEDESMLLRGGSWIGGPGGCRSACRAPFQLGIAGIFVGFRVVAGPGEPEPMLLRGGSWFGFPGFCRSAYRAYLRPDDAYRLVGFRVVAGSGEPEPYHHTQTRGHCVDGGDTTPRRCA